MAAEPDDREDRIRHRRVVGQRLARRAEHAHVDGVAERGHDERRQPRGRQPGHHAACVGVLAGDLEAARDLVDLLDPHRPSNFGSRRATKAS
jgi:hypothetical protein